MSKRKPSVALKKKSMSFRIIYVGKNPTIVCFYDMQELEDWRKGFPLGTEGA